jgi:hypothetical protein
MIDSHQAGQYDRVDLGFAKMGLFFSSWHGHIC